MSAVFQNVRRVVSVAVAAAVGGIYTTLSASGGASLISFIHGGVGAVKRTVEDRLREVVSVRDFGAVGDGVTDDTAAIQKAINTGKNVVIPRSSGAYLYSATLTIASPMMLVIDGTLTARINAAASGTPTIVVTASGVTIKGAGGIDNVSAAYAKWAGIYASGGALVRLSSVHVRNLFFRNLSVDDKAAFAVNFDGCDYSTMVGNELERVGVLSNINGGGYGLYMQFCAACTVTKNNLRYVGSSGINDSAGRGNLITANTESYITLFANKGGYAQNVSAVTADIAPSLYGFSVQRTDSARRNLLPGYAVVVFNPTGPFGIAMISKVQDKGTYLQVFLQNAPLDVVPQAGAQVQLLLTHTVWTHNQVHYCGDNAWDLNGWYGVLVQGNVMQGAGMYSEPGNYGGLGCGVWAGYDEQAGENRMLSGKLSVIGNLSEDSAGTAFCVMSTAGDVVIDLNMISEANRRGSIGSDGLPSAGCIEVHRLAFYRSKRASICGNSGKSQQGFGIYSSYGSGNLTDDNNIEVADLALIINSQNDSSYKGNRLRTLIGTGGVAAVLIRDGSGVNSNANVRLLDNDINVASGYPIKNTDAGYDPTIGNFGGNTCAGGDNGLALWSVTGAQVPLESMNGAIFYERKNTGIIANNESLLISSVLPEQGAVFLISVTAAAYPNVSTHGLYVARRSAGTTYVTPILANAEVSVEVDGFSRVRLKNVSGGGRQLFASLTKLQ